MRSRGGGYAFRFTSDPIPTAHLEGWNRGGPNETFSESINSEEMIAAIREVRRILGLLKADAQAKPRPTTCLDCTPMRTRRKRGRLHQCSPFHPTTDTRALRCWRIKAWKCSSAARA
jgi:hypothetical protein